MTALCCLKEGFVTYKEPSSQHFVCGDVEKDRMGADGHVLAFRTPVQLTLAFSHPPAFGDEDFWVTPSNQAAFNLIMSWPYWPTRTVLLMGPSGCGKTHLASIWRKRSQCFCLQKEALHRIPEAVLDRSAFEQPKAALLEDLDCGDPLDEVALFHLLNTLRQHDVFLLMTSRSSPLSWELHLPDLRSRLRAAVPVWIQSPDESLLRFVLLKLFSDRQLTIDPTVIAYLLPRMERSLQAAQRIVALLDEESLARGRPISRLMAAHVLKYLEKQKESGRNCSDGRV